jgi:hypothetical protein
MYRVIKLRSTDIQGQKMFAEMRENGCYQYMGNLNTFGEEIVCTSCCTMEEIRGVAWEYVN